MVCAPTELQQNTPARAVNELHRAGAPLFYKENAQSGDFRQYRTILSADTASEARQLLSQKLVDYRAFWQRRCRAAAAGAVLKPSSGNCAVLL